MIINHNLTAMNMSRQLNIVTDGIEKSAGKLSSGYKINGASDDAAGLAISEKMRWQVRGLNQGVRNIQDGISLIQVADGALQEAHDVMQRVNELATQAANDTLTAQDRSQIQKEVDQLATEIDRIATTTSFNAEIYPLNGSSMTVEYPDCLQGMDVTVQNLGTGTLNYDGTICPSGGHSPFQMRSVM